ncbi:OmpA family protein [Sphingomonas sp. Leaf62]|uniref:OmpA family protein n=1 Tax=Sphingomonas sp. Leaf62 TaxID=1736228 RepID=UPI00138F15D9|nr:OmpA family protein [Sphingomonas sp. Leaf62]
MVGFARRWLNFAVSTAALIVVATGIKAYAQADSHMPGPVESGQSTTIYFAYNSSRLSNPSKEAIARAARAAISSAADKVQVVGHADQAGDPTYNVLLSQRRARRVVAALIAAGAPARMLSADWQGEYQPAMPSEDQPEALNRRVVITIVE